ncbi:hypothetical protein G7046_g1487 [Stylonectria norvegica]|nr:hypothetical protein G7046_g1487 [Stylonectria norvegica]
MMNSPGFAMADGDSQPASGGDEYVHLSGLWDDNAPITVPYSERDASPYDSLPTPFLTPETTSLNETATSARLSDWALLDLPFGNFPTGGFSISTLDHSAIWPENWDSAALPRRCEGTNVGHSSTVLSQPSSGSSMNVSPQYSLLSPTMVSEEYLDDKFEAEGKEERVIKRKRHHDEVKTSSPTTTTTITAKKQPPKPTSQAKLRTASRAPKKRTANTRHKPAASTEESQARATHNQVEQQYRKRLNAHFELLLQALPEPDAATERRRVSKVDVLDRARRRIGELEGEMVLCDQRRAIYYSTTSTTLHLPTTPSPSRNHHHGSNHASLLSLASKSLIFTYSNTSLSLSSRTYTLNTGDKIPAVGLGTWQSKPNEVSTAVEAALRAGYRHIDTAFAYGNEKEVGAGIKASAVPREEIWLTTKLDNPWHKRVPEAITKSLENLGTDYVDLYLMHWPSSSDPEDLKKHYPDWDFRDTWREMQKLVGTGKVKNIGVSNFGIQNLEKLLNDPTTKIVPAVNQIELHPCNPSPKLVAYNTSKGIHSTGYSCLGSTDSPLYTNETLLKIAEAKGKTPQQVLLLWGLSKGWSVIPKSVTPKRIQANWELDGWELSDDEVKAIDGIPDRFKVCGDKWLPIRVFFGDDE